MENNLCVNCDGKGFNWIVRGVIRNHAGQDIATTYNQGEKCMTCKGTGRASRPVSCGGYVIVALVLTLFFAFVANPIAHLISS